MTLIAFPVMSFVEAVSNLTHGSFLITFSFDGTSSTVLSPEGIENKLTPRILPN